VYWTSDVGLASFYTNHNDNKVDNPRFLRKSEKRLKRVQRRLSKKKKGSKNRQKARQRLAKAHLKVSRQRQDSAVKLARCVVHSNDVIAYEDLRVKNLVKNHCLAKSINDAVWYQFREWIEYFGVKFGKITIMSHRTIQAKTVQTVVKLSENLYRLEPISASVDVF
jgi:putative transposase